MWTPPAPVSSFLPIILLAELFGLAMDYEVFLVLRMRESYLHTGNPLGAVHSGARHSGRVVTAAALIMTSVFAAFLTSDSTMLNRSPSHSPPVSCSTRSSSG